MMRRLRWFDGSPLPIKRLIFAMVAGVAIVTFCTIGYRNATAAPVVRSLTLRLPSYPAGARPLRLILFSDLHVQGPDMPPSRVAGIVKQINALKPDVVVSAGDFHGSSGLGWQYTIAEAVAPLRDLKARLGVYAVLGNNDWQPTKSVRALSRVGVHVLMNQALEVGPVALGGLNGRLAHSQPALDEARARTYTALERLPGIKILIGHRPDEFVAAPNFITLVLAGHTHCGQIVLPLVGRLMTGSSYGREYACGVFRVGDSVLVVTSGLGTSHVPLRIGAPPDLWLITIEGNQNG